jgi:hypothetical protein
MERGERRRRTEVIVARRIRAWMATAHPLWTKRSDRNPKARVFRVRVGNLTRWTYHEWLAKPGIARKNNGAHGRCCLCDDEPNAKRQGLTLDQELDLLDQISRSRAKAHRRKDTKRWCRGKVGVPHRAQWQPMGGSWNHYLLLCEACGRHLDWCFHAPWRFRKAPCRCPLGRGPPRMQFPPFL